MYFVNVNGREYITAHDKSLVTFLRDELNMTGTKDAANADWVLVDGVKTSARSVKLSCLKGKEILTIEGIEGAQLKAYAAQLMYSGGLGSGFFAPGMVISAKEKNAQLPAIEPVDAQTLEKVSGKKIFADDVNVPRQVYVRPVFAKYPGAKITKIDMSKAIENVRFGDCILKEDIPGAFDGMIGVDDRVGSADDVVALVVTTYLAEMNVLCALIDVEYDAVTEAVEREASEMPECAAAIYSDDDTLTVYTNGGDPEGLRQACAKALDIPAEWITCVSSPVEGARAGRAEVFAALAAWMTQQPVKVKF